MKNRVYAIVMTFIVIAISGFVGLAQSQSTEDQNSVSINIRIEQETGRWWIGPFPADFFGLPAVLGEEQLAVAGELKMLGYMLTQMALKSRSMILTCYLHHGRKTT